MIRRRPTNDYDTRSYDCDTSQQQEILIAHSYELAENS